MFGLGFRFPQLAAGGGASSPSLSEQVRKLFANGEQGGMWDFTNPEGLYQDAAGTTPVTAVGQPVGLMLDRRFGLERGPEMMPASPVWNLSDNPTAIVSGHRVEFLEQGNVRTAIGSDNGRNYEVAFDVVQTGPSVLQVFVGGIIGSLRFNADTPVGRVTGIKIMSSGSRAGDILFGGTNAGWIIDNISVREIPGNHLSQDTTAARPTYTEDGALHDGVDDFLMAANAADWTFLHDGSGGYMAASTIYSDVEGSDSSGYFGTQANGASTVGLRVGNQARSLSRSIANVGNGSGYVSTTSSGSGSIVPESLVTEEVDHSGGRITATLNGVEYGSEDYAGFTPSPSIPANPFRTHINTGLVLTRRRMLAISRTLAESERASVNAWLMEGVE